MTEVITTARNVENLDKSSTQKQQKKYILLYNVHLLKKWTFHLSRVCEFTL